VTALEPSTEMIAQRPADGEPVMQGIAEALPFADASFDAAMGVLTVHHWSNPASLSEMRRVARGPVVLLPFDPDSRVAWIFDYWPQLADLDKAIMPRLSLYAEVLGDKELIPLPIPADCTEGFLYAYWRRPAAYLDPVVRKAISSFWKIEDAEGGFERLAADLECGAWTERCGRPARAGDDRRGVCLVVSQPA
jgi:ubiquinone/menaquinone biosynthesis C-methylase UbiE